MYNRNLLNNISPEFTWADYRRFKTHLRLPLPYLVVLFKNYAKTNDMIYNLSRVVEAYHKHLWGKILDKTLQQKLFQLANIPPLFIRESKIVICSKPKEQELFDSIAANASKLVKTGKQLYFYSNFMEAAMTAAIKIAMNAINSYTGKNYTTMLGKIYCCNLGTYLETFKETWDAKDTVIKNSREADLLVLYGVGNEYTTEFTSSYLFSLLDQRGVEGRSTILVSSLSPTQFTERYGKEFVSTVVEFKDTKIKQTLEDLAKELSE